MSHEGPRFITRDKEIRFSQRTRNYSSLIAELKQVQQKKNFTPSSLKYQSYEEKPQELKHKMDYLKSRATAIERDILLKLQNLQELHCQEIELIKTEFKRQNIGYHQHLRSYLFEHQKHIEVIVQDYVNTILTLDPSALKDVEQMLGKLLEKLGSEAEEAIWGKKSRWSRVKTAVKRIFGKK